MVRGDGRSVSEVYVLTVTFYYVVAPVGCCAECIPYVRYLEYCWFVHDVALIICYFYGCIDDYCVIIPILDYLLLYLVVFIFLALYGCTYFEFSFCACGLVFLLGLDKNSARGE